MSSDNRGVPSGATSPPVRRVERWVVPATALLTALSIAVVLMALASTGRMPSAEAYSVPEFADVGATHEYHDAIMGLREHGSAGGYPDNSYRPENPIWRAQFAKMIVVTLGMTDKLGTHVTESMVAPFTDLGPDDPASLYPHDYVAVVADRGVTLGTTAGHFSPWKNITRAQVMTMVIRAAMEMYPGVIATPPASYTSLVGAFDTYHSEFWRLAEYNGLLNGLTGWGTGSDPFSDALRGEVAQILWNMLGAS